MIVKRSGQSNRNAYVGYAKTRDETSSTLSHPRSTASQISRRSTLIPINPPEEPKAKAPQPGDVVSYTYDGKKKR